MCTRWVRWVGCHGLMCYSVSGYWRLRADVKGSNVPSLLESVKGWRKDEVQWMSLALVGDREGIWPKKSLHQLLLIKCTFRPLFFLHSPYIIRGRMAVDLVSVWCQEVISEDLRATLNAFLYRTGEQSNKYVTNMYRVVHKNMAVYFLWQILTNLFCTL